MAEKKRDLGYQVLARKWRPKNFEEVIGQETICTSLRNALREKRIGNAYLFAGPRGVGKTTLARIFAMSLNCEKGVSPTPCGRCASCLGIIAGTDLDVIEIDGASYTGIDNVRELQEGIGHSPFAGRYKVYIIDEVHMLSPQAFNALLKTIEEPPPAVVFVFATTAPERIPQTIQSRCQRFYFRRVGVGDIMKRLEFILDKEKNITIPNDEKQRILEALAVNADGSMRDAEVALDQLISLSGGEPRLEYVEQLFDIVESDLLIETLLALEKKQTQKLLARVAELAERGRDLERYGQAFSRFLRDALILKATGEAELLNLPEEKRALLRKEVEPMSYPFLLNLMNQFLQLETEMRTSVHPRFLLEYTFIKLTTLDPSLSIHNLLEQLSGIEDDLGELEAPPAHTTEQDMFGNPAKDESLGNSALGNEFAEQPPAEQYGADLLAENSFGQNEASRVATPETEAETASPCTEQPILNDLAALWQHLLRATESKKHILEHALRDCRPLRVENDTLHVSIVANQTYNQRLLGKKDNIDTICACLQQVTGKPLRVKIALGTDEAPAPVAPAAASSVAQATEAEKPPLDIIEPENNVLEVDDSLVREALRAEPPSEGDVENVLERQPELKSTTERVLKLFGGKIVGFEPEQPD